MFGEFETWREMATGWHGSEEFSKSDWKPIKLIWIDFLLLFFNSTRSYMSYYLV